MDVDSVLTPSQTARALGVSVQWVRELTKSGALPSVRTPLGRLIPAAAVEQLRQARATRSA